MFDSTVGQVISTAVSPGRYFNALAFGTFGNQLRHLRISHAQYGIHAFEINLRHAQFTQCDVPLHPEGICNADNVLLADVGCAVGGSMYTVAASHWTVHNCASLLTADWGPEYCYVRITNSIFVNIADPGPVTDVLYDHCTSFLPSEPSPFLSVGGGSRYLANGSEWRDQGTSELDPELLAELAQRTTQAPELRTGTVVQPLTLAPRGLADQGLSPDLGYHYPVVDWLVNGLDIQSATLLITDGAVVAVGDGGMSLQGATLHSHGTPTRLNRLLPSMAVQEGPMTSNSSGTYSLIDDAPLGAVMPVISMRFTEFSAPGGANSYFDWGLYAQTFELSHSRFHGGRLSFALYGNQGRNIGWTNNLFERVTVAVNCFQPATVYLYNNLFRHGYVLMNKDALSSWQVHDNIFDLCELFDDGPSTANSHNAYVGGVNVLPGSDGGDQVPPSIPYESARLGIYYLPPGSPLINAGSRSAASAGLYHFTSVASQLKEGADPGSPPGYKVDIGLHYVALSTQPTMLNQPMDTDGDCLADYFEDVNGDGEFANPDIASWLAMDTDSDGLTDAEEHVFGFSPASDQGLPTANWRYYHYNLVNRLISISGNHSAIITPDKEGNIQTVSP